MIKLWGYKLPLRCYQRGVRPFMKTARDDVVMFDDSYFRMLRIRFSSSDQLASYKQRYFELRNESCCSLNGLRVSGSGIQQLFLMDREK
jgi:hypothetical protein